MIEIYKIRIKQFRADMSIRLVGFHKMRLGVWEIAIVQIWIYLPFRRNKAYRLLVSSVKGLCI